MNPQFRIRNPKSDAPTSIRLLSYINDKRLVYSIGESIHPKYWDKKAQRAIIPRGNKELQDQCRDINTIIDRVQDALIKSYSELIRLDIPITVDNIKEELNKKLTNKKKKKSVFVVDFLSSFISDIESGAITTERGRYADGTIRAYYCTLHHLEEYENRNHVRVRFDRLTTEFYSKFRSFLSKTYKPNTIGKDIKNLKVIARMARRGGIDVNNQFEDFKTIAIDVDVIYLDIDELNKIEQSNLSNKPMLDNARDLFLLSCWTGLRYSDIAKLREEHFTNGGSRIKLSMKKTSNPIVIPVYLPVHRIREKYNGLPRIISNVKLNAYIKDVCKIAGIDQMIPVKEYKDGMTYEVMKPKFSLVTVHTGRRSFATNLYKTGAVTVRDIMAVTGHRSESAFYKYIRITPEESADRLESVDFSSSLKVAR
ncbi:MAG: site-specific integrase [Methanosarcinaceae archaeon]|nr:site-specific integrase [Methanosarcinaceae archaeon]